MKKPILFFAITTVCSLTTIAQTDVDALRYSQTTFNGTARSVGMGGAFGAHGGDFSALSINPAGIAFYQKSELTLTPSFVYQNTTSDFLRNSISDNKYNFNFGNTGLIISIVSKDNDATTHKWMNLNFGFGYNRLNNFQSKSEYEGMNPNNSLLDSYLEKVNNGAGTNQWDMATRFPFNANLAYMTWLINPIDSIDTTHYNNVIHNAGELQRKTVTTTGGMGEYVFSFGANYSNRLYLGATLGVVTLQYNETSTYEETDKNNTISGFKSFSLGQNLSTTGNGYNFKFGMLCRATDWLRIGASVHTPTFLMMKDEYSASIKSYWDNTDTTYSKDSPNGSFNYNLTTPLKATASASITIGKIGMFSADYEIVDYSQSRLNSSTDNFFDANSSIQEKYTIAKNVRGGTEWRYEQYNFRCGYAFYGSPFKSNVGSADFSRTSYTLGFGIKDEDYFLDFGYILTKATEYYQPYRLNNQEVAGVTNKIMNHNFLMTMGFKF